MRQEIGCERENEAKWKSVSSKRVFIYIRWMLFAYVCVYVCACERDRGDGPETLAMAGAPKGET